MTTPNRTSSRSILAAGAAALMLGGLFLRGPARAEEMRIMPPPAADAPVTAPTQVAVLAGGCFWGVQGVFEHVKGVSRVVAGYAGGPRDQADYETVSTGTTGHAESVEITYDPHEISYGRLLQIYFSVATDPTTKDAQGPDSGTQYRSNVFYTTPEQQRVAQAYIAQLDAAHLYGKPIVTKIDKLTGFYPAEAYHQDFLVNHPSYPYIVVNDMPKVTALQRLFPTLYQAEPRVTGIKSDEPS